MFRVHDCGDQRRRRNAVRQQSRRARSANNLILILRRVDRDVMLHHFFRGGMVFQLAVYFIREPLPSAFSKCGNQLLFGQLILLFSGREALQHLAQLAGLSLVPHIGDRLSLRLRNLGLSRLLLRLGFQFIEYALLTQNFQTFAFTSKNAATALLRSAPQTRRFAAEAA